MTKNELQQLKRFAIAKACGWRRVTAPDGYPQATWKSASGMWRSSIPDYLSDLNAMHGAVLTLTDEELRRFASALGVMMLGQKFDEWDRTHWPFVLRATPEQWCDAFIETKGIKL